MEWFVWMWRVALSLATVRTSQGVRAGRLLIDKTEMAMGCRGMGGEKVGVKCGCMQGCCEGARLGVRSSPCMVQEVLSSKTNRVGAAARQS